MRLARARAQAISRAQSHRKLVRLYGVATQAQIAVDLARQEHDLAFAA